MQNDAIAGALLGCAIGDALGLPYEGLSRRRAAKLLGRPTGHRFFFGRGMVSDDTEHTCMVALAYCQEPESVDAFMRDFARRLRWWIARLPAGVGMATARACIKLWLGFPPERSGVLSAGNGPAMRSSILGATIEDLPLLAAYVYASARVTHRDPRALNGALAVGLAAWCAKHDISRAEDFLERWRKFAPQAIGSELEGRIAEAVASVASGESTQDFAVRTLGERGISGYVLHTVPAVIHAWLSYPTDYRAAVASIIECGGDADTTAAIVGGIVGSGVGRGGIPREWREGLWEWPHGVSWMEKLSDTVASTSQGNRRPAPGMAYLRTLARNFVFLAIVLAHGFRRLLPPY